MSLHLVFRSLSRLNIYESLEGLVFIRLSGDWKLEDYALQAPSFKTD
jgi:hypothetical protein